jgi:uncharacterized protein
MLYLDTCVVMSVLTNEPRSTAVEAWLTAQSIDDLAISDWVVTEFSSALSIKVRTGAISTVQRSAIRAQFTQSVINTFAFLPVTATAFRTAARFCDQSQLDLRAGDALHLSICAEQGASLCTLDHVLGRAASSVGLTSLLI